MRTARLSDCERDLDRARDSIRVLSKEREALSAVLRGAAVGWTLVHGEIVYPDEYSMMVDDLYAKDDLRGGFEMAEYQTLAPVEDRAREIEDRWVIAFEDARDAVEFKLSNNLDA